MPRIICAGLITADLVFEVAAFPDKGTKNRALESRMITGGGAMNAASAIAGLGGNASVVGTIGDDLFGGFLRQKMVERGIDDRYVTTVAGAGTPRSAIMIDPDGDRTIINHREPTLIASSARLPPTVPFDAALVDTRWPDAAAQIMQTARRAKKPAVIDAEAPVAEAELALSLATHVVFSEQGLSDYIGDCNALALEKAAHRLGAWCAVTRGALPVLCHDGLSPIEVPTYSTMALNTLGAGDVWHGAFTLALANMQPELAAVQWANAVASLKVSRPITDEAFPTAAEVDAFLKSRTAP